MTRLHDLYASQGQSPWLDNIRRGWLTSGELAGWVDRGVRGLTSNPSIFQKAIQGSAEYDDQFRESIGAGLDLEASYWELVTSDISAALAILRPVYDGSGGLDGYVSVEVDPGLARDSAGTEAAARDLDVRLDDRLPLEGEYVAKRSVRRRVLRSEVHDETLIVARLVHLEDVVEVAVRAALLQFFLEGLRARKWGARGEAGALTVLAWTHVSPPRCTPGCAVPARS